jgi:hypothetical protein
MIVVKSISFTTVRNYDYYTYVNYQNYTVNETILY